MSFDGSKPSTKTAATVKSWTLGKAILPDVNDFKGGIFAPGSSKEIFVAAETNNAGLTSDFRLDFFSMSGDVKSLKLETSVQYKSSKEAPNFMKIAVGNFTGSARKEVAVLSNHVDPWKFHLNVYSLEWYGGKLEVTNTVKDLEVYAHDLENNYKTRDEWFFKAAGDIAMADFNGDGRDEIAVVYKGHNEGYTNSYAKDVHNIIGLFHIDVYKYSPQKNPRIEKASSETKNYNNIKELGKDVNGYTDMYTSIGDIKAAAADIDGDGKSELAVLVIKWEISFYKYLIGANDVTWGEWSSLLDIWSFSKSNLKPSFLKNAADFGTFYKNSAKDSKLNFSKASAPRTSLKYGTFTDQAFRIISGTFTGLVNTQAGRSCEDVAVSYSSYEGVRNGYNTLWVKLVTPKFTRKGELNGFSITTPFEFKDTKKNQEMTIGIAAGDFFRSVIVLKNPDHWIITGRRVPTVLVLSPPYHVDYIPSPWSDDKKPRMLNFSYVPDTTVNYTRSNSTQQTKDITSAYSTTWEISLNGSLNYAYGIPLIPKVDDKFVNQIGIQFTFDVGRSATNLYEKHHSF